MRVLFAVLTQTVALRLCLQIFITNMSSVNPTNLNGASVKQTTQVHHKDMFTVIDRSFRFEFPPDSPFRYGAVSCSKPFLSFIRPPQ